MKRARQVGLLLAIAVVLCWPEENVSPQAGDPVLIGAGDISDAFNFTVSNAFATAALIAANPTAKVFADGDLPHNDGTDDDFLNTYAAAWGGFKGRTLPVAGNHEYSSLKALGYYNYWGPAAGDPTKGYYSLNLGAWHIVVLNSNCSFVSCSSGSAQETWLKNDLAANTTACTLALFHHPLYTSSSSVSPNASVQPLWADLYNANADLIVNGHAHNYERFAPQDANGNSDATRGIVEIVSGTGGANLFTFNSTSAANSLVRNSTTWGVLQLTLHATSYNWNFIPIAGQTFTDSGTQACH